MIMTLHLISINLTSHGSGRFAYIFMLIKHNFYANATTIKNFFVVKSEIYLRFTYEKTSNFFSDKFLRFVELKFSNSTQKNVNI